MSFADLFSGAISNRVGNNLTNEEDDVIKTKKNLKRLGYLDKSEEEHGIITREMDTAIKKLQEKSGLKVDGKINPGGETEREIYSSLTGRNSDGYFGRDTSEEDGGSIGFGGNASGTLNPIKIASNSSLQDLLSEISDNSRASNTASNTVNSKKLAELVDSLQGSARETSQSEEDDDAVKYDATGRMIRPERNSEKDSIKKLQELQAKDKEEKKESGQNGEEEKKDEKILTTILNGVNDKALAEEIIGYEDAIEHMYKDSTNHVTVGVGFLIKNVEDAQKLPFEIIDANTGESRKATDAEIKSGFDKIEKVASDNHKADSFKPGKGTKAKAKNLDDLTLPEEEINKLFQEKLKEHAKIVRNKFEGFDEFPPTAQKVLLDLQYNTGLDLSKWKNLKEAVDNRDWKKAADEVNRSDVQKDRNDWAKKGMEDAQEWVDAQKANENESKK